MPDAAVSAAAGVQSDGGHYRVTVPLAEKRRDRGLIDRLF